MKDRHPEVTQIQGDFKIRGQRQKKTPATDLPVLLSEVGPSWAIWGHTGPNWTSLIHSGTFWATLIRSGSFSAIPSHVGIF